MKYFEISNLLEEHHALFYQMWQMGKPILTDTISTACVSFDKETGSFFEYRFNPDFWNSLDDYNKAFVIAHESLHVILHHGSRITDCENPKLMNMALDVVVNESLINKFGFVKEKILNHEKYCWMDTVFKDNNDVLENQSIEYYYSKIEEKIEQMQKDSEQSEGGKGESSESSETLQTVDDHDSLTDDFSEMIDKVNNELTDDEKENLKEFVEKFSEQPEKGIGESGGGVITFASNMKVKPKKKWETVIKKWSKKFTRTGSEESEQWVRQNRRFMQFDSNIILPSNYYYDKPLEGKIEVHFFQDTSGSCAGFIDRFFAAALSLPKQRFDINLHCFDTKVYKTTLESKKLYGFGGTRFDIIESHIQNEMKKNKSKYPQAVFVITDGMGNKVNPQFPKKWYVFLSSDYASCFPKECNIFKLKDFE